MRGLQAMCTRHENSGLDLNKKLSRSPSSTGWLKLEEQGRSKRRIEWRDQRVKGERRGSIRSGWRERSHLDLGFSSCKMGVGERGDLTDP